MSDYKGTDQRAYRTALESALQVADQVVVVGDRASHAGPAVAANAGRARAFRSVREAAEMLKAELRPDDVVLLKGSSRTDHLARIALNLDRERRVECWRHRCGRNVFCDRCGLLGRVAG
jgi:UDP-N-acetylmuramyl pentapeptide synthase